MRNLEVAQLKGIRSESNIFDLAKDIELVRPCFEVWSKDSEHYGVLIRKNVRLMYALNALTNRYDKEYQWLPLEEPLFIVPKTLVSQLQQALGVKAINWPYGL